MMGILNSGDGQQQQSLDGDVNCVTASPDGSMVVVGISHSTVHNNAIKLFAFPCLPKAVPNVHGGHTSSVLNVAFVAALENDDAVSSSNGRMPGIGTYDLLSSDGNDSCVFQWTVNK
jgi:WD40 repeat protein